MIFSANGGYMDYFSRYLEYTDDTECPVNFSRWAAITGLGAFLGRQVWIPFGHSKIYPNIYCMFVGTAGSRKSTTIKMQQRLLSNLGYSSFSPQKVKIETFLKLLADQSNPSGENAAEDFLWRGVNGHAFDGITSEIFVTADEFNNFVGTGNLDFLSILGELWDFEGVYKNPLITRASVEIPNPTISILAGNTPTNLHLAFPPETIGQGFFSRLMFIYGEQRERRIDIPEEPPKEATERLFLALKSIKESRTGAIAMSAEARKLLSAIYRDGSTGIKDVRFDSYNTRRYTHLLKLCLLCFCSRNGTDNLLTAEDVIYANTILTHAELYMPKALGGFGKSKHSDVAHKVQMVIEAAEGSVVDILTIWRNVSADLEKMSQLLEIIQGLVTADRIQTIPGKGFLPKKRVIDMSKNEFVDFSFLTDEEKRMKI